MSAAVVYKVETDKGPRDGVGEQLELLVPPGLQQRASLIGNHFLSFSFFNLICEKINGEHFLEKKSFYFEFIYVWN